MTCPETIAAFTETAEAEKIVLTNRQALRLVEAVDTVIRRKEREAVMALIHELYVQAGARPSFMEVCAAVRKRENDE